ncbi:MAG TPA: hypothetical protein VGG65_09625 [Thermoanaerobaculia bacterium]
MMGHGAAGLLLAIRAVVLTTGEQDPNVLAGVRALGADTVVTFARPSAAASSAASAAGLYYVPFLSVRDVDLLLDDPDALAAVRAIPGIAGFHYRDEDVIEGYTPASEQERAYAILKALFPGLPVLYAIRLDPIATDPGYLDGYVRPQFADAVAPYFYPVATTVLGEYQESDPWEARLLSLLVPLAARLPPGKTVLPVLQGFEQIGFPVGPEFAARQAEVYRAVWPDAADVAAFAWSVGMGEPLVGLSERPALRTGFERLFLGLAPKPAARVVPERPGR